jgi:peptidoglycan/LPS O-acetylase OafA/YrhL
MRMNGFNGPLGKLQMLSWVVTGTLALGFYLIELPFLAPTWRLVIGIFWSFVLAAVCSITIAATSINPGDPAIQKQIEEAAQLVRISGAHIAGVK